MTLLYEEVAQIFCLVLYLQIPFLNFSVLANFQNMEYKREKRKFCVFQFDMGSTRTILLHIVVKETAMFYDVMFFAVV